MGVKGNYKISDSSIPSEFQVAKKHVNEKGMHWFTTSVFIVAEMMGAGLVALPVAVGQTGLIPGVLLLVLGAFFSGFTGIQLGQNWTMMQERWAEYRQACRSPYPEMARRALGRRAKYVMDVCLAITLYGIVTVLLLFSAKNISHLLDGLFSWRIDFCILILAVGISVWPFTLLRSPMHFWQAAVLSAISSAIAACLVIYGVAHDGPVCYQHSSYPTFTWTNLFLGYGTMIFAYGGHSGFPTFQHDMKKPVHFTRSVLVSYIFILIVYLVVSVGGIEVYGDSIKDTIIPSIQLKWVSMVVNILITTHVVPTIIIVFCPLAQQIEDWTRIPHEFGIKRVIVRTLVLIICLITAMSVPKFGLILDLVGGSTVTLMTMLLPSVFWLYLNSKRRLHKLNLASDDHRPTFREIFDHTPKWLLVLNIVSLLFGFIGGIVATTTAVTQLFGSEMAPPCYLKWFRGSTEEASVTFGATHCCGPFRNITVSGISPEGFCQMTS